MGKPEDEIEDDVDVDALLAREPSMDEYIEKKSPNQLDIDLPISFVQSATFGASVFGKVVI